MKKLCFLLLSLLLSCEKTKTSSLELTVLVDRTDASIPKPTLEDIQSVIGTHCDAIHFRWMNIGNTDFNPTYRLDLAPSDLLGNRLERKVEVQIFYTQLDSLLKREHAQTYHYKNSSIYRPLLKTLIQTSQGNASQKVVLLYSDLHESSDLFNAYDTTQRRQLFDHLDKVVAHFQAVGDIPDLRGVHLYLIYYPTTNQENRNYRQWLALYRALFSNSGLSIHQGMDNAFHHNNE